MRAYIDPMATLTRQNALAGPFSGVSDPSQLGLIPAFVGLGACRVDGYSPPYHYRLQPPTRLASTYPVPCPVQGYACVRACARAYACIPA